MDVFFKADGVTGVRRMFYAAASFFIISVIIEEIYLRFKDGGKEDRFADSITSMIAGMFMVITGLFTKAMELGIYVYVFENFCIYELPWDSPWTWFFSFLGIDLGYYWFHRMSHDHQESGTIGVCSEHAKSSSCSSRIGYFLGTFETENDIVAYGLVHPLTTYNPISVQLCHLQWMWSVFWTTPGLMNKVFVIFKGPGWQPGKPRTGLIEDIPDICGPEQNKYNTTIPGWLKAYIVFHFAINFLLLQTFIDQCKELSQLQVLMGMVFEIYTFTCIGMLCNLKPWWNVLAEMVRCAAVFTLTSLAIHQDVEAGDALLFLQVTYGLSVLFWFLRPGSR
ncbi:alkylglycerol monooxygenase-like [Strongylocentrotus purpuratus]|uniref:Alkylglycerol monooxygenase C-terminal domain-containing protein n=1 Tax=Strongylocentrotus purpuratus TaxID=7668 RepID=A0A7M7MYY1_STRPU|nr:alkylglycerol monooxygenase-like [Strongylocentrotus purpuratus]